MKVYPGFLIIHINEEIKNNPLHEVLACLYPGTGHPNVHLEAGNLNAY